MPKLPRAVKSVIGAISILIIFELLIFRVWSFTGFGIMAFILLIGFFVWIEKKALLKREVLIKIILPLILLASTVAFIFFEANIYFIQLVIILSSFCFYLFFSRLNFPLSKEDSVIVTYYWLDLIAFLAAFLSFLFVLNLLFIKDLPIWFLMILVTLISYLIFAYVLWARSKEGRIVPLFSSLFALILLESFLVMSFWNVDPVPKSLLMVIVLYFYLGVLDLKLRGSLTGRKIIEYLLTSIIAALLVIITIRW